MIPLQMYDNMLRKAELFENIKQISMTGSEAVSGKKILRLHFITLSYCIFV